MITCLIAFPDSVTPELEFTFSDAREQTVDPVYPAPEQVMSFRFTRCLVDSFVQDSTAYASDEFWPAERVRIIGETRICDQRLLQVQLFPAQYRASDSTLSIVSNFSVSLAFDSASAVWSDVGLGSFQQMVVGSPIIGYHQQPQTHAPIPTNFGKISVRDLEGGPSRMPDYLIICASGLYDQCSIAIDDLADHRVDLNGFDVALVTTDDILSVFGQSATVITDDIIRTFTDHVWTDWGVSTSNKTPDYLLLIGDHEDEEYSDEDWFLPTHLYPVNPGTMEYYIGNDEWYTYFNQPTSVNNAFPEMCVGRLSVKNGDGIGEDTLSTLIYNLIDLEDPITQVPLTDYRRRILRLAGTGSKVTGVFHQGFGTANKPLDPWTEDFSDWMDYNFANFYCGDGRWQTISDLSEMKSREWVTNCVDELSYGAGVAFYSDHGEFHMFSAGLEWCPWLIDDPLMTKGAKDSTFNNYQIQTRLTSTEEGYSAPFMLSLCCLNGTFNHTQEEHRDRSSHTYFCHDDGSDTTVPRIPAYDFGTDCLAERLLKNTAVPVAGVFAGSEVSFMTYYEYYGKGILEAVYARGFGRLGDAINYARCLYEGEFATSSGAGNKALGQFNLLGDPALDISDRVRYPDNCDLLVYGEDFSVSEYPIGGSSGITLPISFTILNAGGKDSGSFVTKITFEDDSNSETINFTCTSIDAGFPQEFQYTWPCRPWVRTPEELNVTLEIQSPSSPNPTDSWMGNNSSSQSVQLNDTYPIEAGWPISTEGIVSKTPLLVNLDFDTDLEIVVLTGTTLTAFEKDGSKIWEFCSEDLTSNQPLAANLDQTGHVELLITYADGIKVVKHDGSLLCDFETDGSFFAVGEMTSASNLEFCVVTDPEILELYHWDAVNDEFDYITSKTLTLGQGAYPTSISCADLIGTDGYDDVIYGSAIWTQAPSYQESNLIVLDWGDVNNPFTATWDDVCANVSPAAGELAGRRMVGYPLKTYDYQATGEYPAGLLEPSGTIDVNCAKGNTDADRLMYGVFADWLALPLGADTFILPSEMQCLAWNYQGLALDGFPTGRYSGASIGSMISPTALGNLDASANADVLFSANGILYAIDSDGNDLTDFPITLPDGIGAIGGFAIADIDRDDKVEVVFGTSDGYLHVWEFGACATGYAPWTQFQHDAGRTGVLD